MLKIWHENGSFVNGITLNSNINSIEFCQDSQMIVGMMGVKAHLIDFVNMTFYKSIDIKSDVYIALKYNNIILMALLDGLHGYNLNNFSNIFQIQMIK